MLTVKRFTADWCGPCRSLAPIMNQVASEISGVRFETIDVDVDNAQAQKYGVRNIPLVVLEKDGKVLDKLTGVQSKQVYVQAINEHK